MPSLYVLSNQYKAIESKLIDMDIDQQTIDDTLESVAGEVEEKATNVAMVIRNMEAFIEQMKEAERQMQERRKAYERRAERINDYLLENMKRTGITKIESPYFTVSRKNNPPSVVIDDEGELDGKWWKHKTIASIDKSSIKLALQSGELVPGARLESGERIEIK